jgi:hypothetical protein
MVQPTRLAAAAGAEVGSHEEALWTFARIPVIKPMNDAAEMSIRKSTLWRKGCSGLASPEGARIVERLLTICETLRAHGRLILDFPEDSIRAWLRRQALRLFSLPARPEPPRPPTSRMDVTRTDSGPLNSLISLKPLDQLVGKLTNLR